MRSAGAGPGAGAGAPPSARRAPAGRRRDRAAGPAGGARAPPGAEGPGDWPHLVPLPHDSTYLSRLHVRIDLDGWHVLARDLGSRGGTTLFAPGRDPEKIRGHEPHLLESGTTLDLAGAYQVTYLSTVPTSGAAT